MIDNHIVSEIGNVIVKWEVKEKILGNKAIKFINKIVVNINIIITSVLFSVFFIVNFTSFFMFIKIKLFNIEIGFFIFHIFMVVRIVTSVRVNQDMESILELGSKIENRFVIILVFFLLMLYLFFCLLFLIVILYLLYL